MRVDAATIDMFVRKSWCSALDVDSVADDDDFFSLGGNSLLAVGLLESIEAHAGVQVPFEAFFVAGTFRALRDSVLEATGIGPDRGRSGDA